MIKLNLKKRSRDNQGSIQTQEAFTVGWTSVESIEIDFYIGNRYNFKKSNRYGEIVGYLHADTVLFSDHKVQVKFDDGNVEDWDLKDVYYEVEG